MQPADNEFFEEYKHLDKLCGDMYSCRNGISEYIDQMDIKSYKGSPLIPSWNSDYKMLKHIRWVRNQIAHDSGSYQVSEPEDLEFVRNFYDRIFSRQDPLTLLRKEEEKAAEQAAEEGGIQSCSNPCGKGRRRTAGERGPEDGFPADEAVFCVKQEGRQRGRNEI